MLPLSDLVGEVQHGTREVPRQQHCHQLLSPLLSLPQWDRDTPEALQVPPECVELGRHPQRAGLSLGMRSKGNKELREKREKNAKEYLLTNIYVAEKKGEFWLKTEAEKRQLGSQHILETASPL